MYLLAEYLEACKGTVEELRGRLRGDGWLTKFLLNGMAEVVGGEGARVLGGREPWEECLHGFFYVGGGRGSPAVSTTVVEPGIFVDGHLNVNDEVFSSHHLGLP